MVDDLSDPWAELRRLRRDVDRLQTATPLQNASIGSGGLRVYGGGVITIQNGGLSVSGFATISGELNGNGTINWTGPVNFSGAVQVTGTLDVTAETRLRGVTTIEGAARLMSELTVDGKITAGQVRIEGGRVYVGDQMVLDPATDGGAVTFGNGSKVYSNSTAIGLRKGSSSLTVGESLSALLVGGKAITVTPDGVSLTGVREVDSVDGIKWLGITNGGEIVKVAPGVGGPGASLQWPFSPTLVSSEYGPREAPGEGASTFHEGIDLAPGEGALIPAAGAGTVTFSGPNGGFGNCVIIRHSSTLETLYAHMQNLPPVTVGQVVSRGQVIGAVGNTGTSFGAHLHFEVHVNGTPVNPRTKLPAA